MQISRTLTNHVMAFSLKVIILSSPTQFKFKSIRAYEGEIMCVTFDGNDVAKLLIE